MDASTLKRIIRAMNSILNLYDTDFPEEHIDKMMEGIIEVADFLKLTNIAITDDDGFIIKYVMPDDYETWAKTKGEGEK